METNDMKNVNEEMNAGIEPEIEEAVSIDTNDVAAGKIQELAKLKKSSHVMGIIAKILEIVNYVGCGISIFAGLVIAAAPQYSEYVVSSKNAKDFFPSEAWKELVGALDSLGDERWALAAACFATAISCVAVALVFRYVRKTFIQIEAGDTPFTEILTQRIKVIGIIVSAVALLGYGLMEGLIVAAIMLTMYMVFRYGSLLQIESDETV